MFYQKDIPQIPAAAVTAEDADTLAYLAKQGNVRMRLVLTPQKLADVDSYNVVADLKGSQSDQVIVSGHLDSWDLGTGAIDDGAGVVVAMQTAQLISNLGCIPGERSADCAMNEEFGNSGGRAYAADHKADIAKHFAAIESDLGAGHPVGIEHGGPGSKPAIAAADRADSAVEPRGNFRAAEDTETDIGPLLALGVPCLGPYSRLLFYFNHHHTAADTLWHRFSTRIAGERSGDGGAGVFTREHAKRPGKSQRRSLLGSFDIARMLLRSLVSERGTTIYAIYCRKFFLIFSFFSFHLCIVLPITGHV